MGSLRVSKKEMLCGCRKETEMSQAKIKSMIRMVENPGQILKAKDSMLKSEFSWTLEVQRIKRGRHLKFLPQEPELHRIL